MKLIGCRAAICLLAVLALVSLPASLKAAEKPPDGFTADEWEKTVKYVAMRSGLARETVEKYGTSFRIAKMAFKEAGIKDPTEVGLYNLWKVYSNGMTAENCNKSLATAWEVYKMTGVAILSPKDAEKMNMPPKP